MEVMMIMFDTILQE